MSKPKIKKNDQVLVIAGRDRGVRAKVLRVQPRRGTAIVERVNLVKKHTRPNPQRQIQGGILEREAPIRLSNLMVICPDCNEPTRIGKKRLPDGAAVRVCKKCGSESFG
ncbi:MAG: 50S ribosomal protein L24 [Acidobacteria bacterium]|nr:MAG: 50S ribosomal protein L24 [Acidobacteriota bacterium]